MKPAFRKTGGIRCRRDLMNRGKPLKVLCILLIFFWAAALWSSCGKERREDGQEASEPVQSGFTAEGTIVAMGNSLTEGKGVEETMAYPAQLERKLIADGYRFKVVNAGISGETSSGARSRISWVLSTLKPEIVILETGANDGLRGIDPDVLRENLNYLVSRLKQDRVVVLLAGMKMLPNLGLAYTREFEAVYSAIAGDQDVLLIPFFLEGVAGKSKYNQTDGIHPTAEGYRRIVDNIYPYVVQSIETFRENSRNTPER